MSDGFYHLHVKNISRADGRSVVAAAAYRAGDILPNELERRESDFSNKQDVIHTEIMKPDTAPSWMSDRARLWNEVEAVEKRKDSRLAKEIEFSIPRDIPASDRIGLIRTYVMTFVEQGCVVDFVLHEDPENHNPHVHMLLTTRLITPDGFGKKLRELDKKSFVTNARKRWAEIANKALGNTGSSARLDHRSHKARGIDRKPTTHRGPDRAERKQKQIRNAALRQESLPMSKPKPEDRKVSQPQQTDIYGDPELTSWWREIGDEPQRVAKSHDDQGRKNEAVAQTADSTTQKTEHWWQEIGKNPDEIENRHKMSEDVERGDAWRDEHTPDPVPDSDGRPVHPDELELETERERKA